VGFAATFALAAGIVAAGGKPLLGYAHWVAWVVAIGLIVMGLAMVAGRTLHLPLPLFSGGSPRRDLRSMLGYGVAYGAASLSCTLPIFLLVVGTVLTAESAVAALANFLAYAAGMAAVLVAVAVAAALGQAAVAAGLRRLLPQFQRVAGALVVAGGAWLLYVQASTSVFLR
jgi:cytochrome c biogenesis protein CcdA